MKGVMDWRGRARRIVSWGCRAGEGYAGATSSGDVGELGGAGASGQLPGQGTLEGKGEGIGAGRVCLPLAHLLRGCLCM
ncbi:hypothetical protein Tter_1784 [Thermobaculum terrenum ATCC BAA-798]|uniref:Uncharacterized protein n=1 Tax=Thermobaculum terrenum (strain ATCC BAA-798 / CCMEE 7001 / YNP1) TaxID=525904 RepID=D1CD25_THET1|nr:hypothetical protein Tter_0523 [Thermobaculum terrenum ATCC BAA-798]ACZ42690.1 hypothetical protein Tter_1784 [Thermobaculum terrenum ATCC BAA-798]